MRKLLLATAALVMFTGAAHADAADGAAMVMFYDAKCEKLPASMIEGMETVQKALPADVYASGWDRVKSAYEKYGEARWCQMTRRVLVAFAR